MESTSFNKIDFDMLKSKSNVIKVVGVGGGGSNAVNHMFSQGIKGVDFAICNTDAQALQNSGVPNKVQLGVGLTEGLGAGANPEVGERAAEENIEEIKEMLSSNTKMVFITAGMGGGTGTGAAPVIAKVARELDLLTIGIVTIPFGFEGKVRKEQAQKGIEKMAKYVDSMIVINNNKLRDVYGNLGFKAGFAKVDEVLSTASRGIAEVITHHYKHNIDLKDAKTVLANSGTAIMGSATAVGENRAKEAISKALDSPLLNDNKITGAKNVLLLIVSGAEEEKEITIDEIGEISDYIRSEAKTDVNIIMGLGENESLEGAISVTVVATGFNREQQFKIANTKTKKIIYTLEEGQQATFDFTKSIDEVEKTNKPIEDEDLFSVKNEKKVHQLEEIEQEIKEEVTNTEKKEKVEESVEEFDEYEIVTIKSEEQEEVEEEISATPLLFDFPIAKTKEIESEKAVKEEVSEVLNNNNENKTVAKEVRYSLPEYMEVEDKLTQAKPKKTVAVNKEENEEDQSMQITLKRKEDHKNELVDSTNHVDVPNKSVKATPFDASVEDLKKAVTPFDVGIEELKKTAAERKETLKNFNYKFLKKAVDKGIDEYERQPAYKRMGVELENNENAQEGASRLTLNIDDDNDINLRSNNSFLHDNVD